MSITSTDTPEQRTDEAARPLPAIAPADRLALRIGTRLILWSADRGRHRADRDARTEQSRIGRAAAHAERASRDAFERRTTAGPTW